MSISVKVPVVLLLASYTSAGMALPVFAQSVMFYFTRYVDVNGVPTNGVRVSCLDASYITTTGQCSPGRYTLMPSVVTVGQELTVSFSYNGHTTPTPTVTPTTALAPIRTITPSPTTTPSPSVSQAEAPTISPSPYLGPSSSVLNLNKGWNLVPITLVNNSFWADRLESTARNLNFGEI
jgi:hypothetical protein